MGFSWELRNCLDEAETNGMVYVGDEDINDVLDFTGVRTMDECRVLQRREDVLQYTAVAQILLKVERPSNRLLISMYYLAAGRAKLHTLGEYCPRRNKLRSEGLKEYQALKRWAKGLEEGDPRFVGAL